MLSFSYTHMQYHMKWICLKTNAKFQLLNIVLFFYRHLVTPSNDTDLLFLTGNGGEPLEKKKKKKKRQTKIRGTP